MAYALRPQGHLTQAKALIDKHTRWACRRANGKCTSLNVEPWQQRRERALRDTTIAICPVEKSCKP